MSFKKFYFLITAFLFVTVNAFSQQNKPVLERFITLKFVNEKTDVVLNKLSMQAGFAFSYNPAVIDVNVTVSGNYVNKPLREVLNELFDGRIEYKERGKYVILQRKREREVKTDVKEFITFSGYVRDELGMPVPWASVYDKQSLESTVSNDYGFYKIRFSTNQLPVNLFYSKQGFIDTMIVFENNSPEFINVTLSAKVIPKPQAINIDSLAKSAEQTASSFFSSLESPANAKNINDTIYRDWQISFIPFAGTNGKLSGNVINKYSFNIVGGYSLGTGMLELSGFFNLNRGDVKYVQLAGFANVSGGEVQGAQLAGFTNIVKENVKATQLAGFANLDMQKFRGAQLSGFVNVVMDTVRGAQVAGFCNVAKRSITGTQISGFCNVVMESLTGTQLGVVNYARRSNGSQLGFLNVAETTTGVPVGFLSYVHNGYHKIEISADEVFYTNIALRTGVNAFHNILVSGINPSSDSLLLWHFGYGVGTTLLLGKKTALDFDVTASQIVKGNDFDKLNVLAKGYLGADIKLVKKISLAIGVTVNGQITKTDYQDYPDIFTWNNPNIFYDTTWELDKTRLQMWLGGKIGLRFF